MTIDERTTRPPESSRPGAWLERALAVLALRLRQEVAITRALRGNTRQEAFLGLFVSDDEAEAILTEASGRLRASGTAASMAELVALQAQLDAERCADPEGVWARLTNDFGLGTPELDLLLLAAAPSLDPRIGRVYGYLNDDVARRHLTPALAVRLLDRHAMSTSVLRRILAADGPLRQQALLRLGDERPLVEAPVRVDDDLLDRLLGIDGIPAGLAHVCESFVVPRRRDGLVAGTWLLDGSEPAGRPGETALELAGRLGLDVLLVSAGRLGVRPAETTAACLREARLERALPVLTGFDALDTVVRHEIASVLTPPVALLTQHRLAWEESGLVPSRAPSLDTSRRERIAALLRGHPAESEELHAWVDRLGHLDLLTFADLLARHRDPVSLRASVRSRISRDLVGLAEPISDGHRLQDLVVPGRTRAALRSLISWRDTRSLVRDEWGLGPLFGKSPSIVALFKGPSGTGKTMAASAVANALELPLFKVSVAALVSKYIGETEKNLDRLFAAAEAADVVLFFDEADAVFGQRSEVRDSHDRYANLGTAYLLQRLDSFDGVAVLASNLHNNIDTAFMRRFDIVVDFPLPSPTARRAIWQRLHDSNAPMSGDIDLDLLAERFDLSGGEIRNCCLAAAHAAGAAGRSIDMAVLMQAVGRELAKLGKPVRRSDFGEHWAALRADAEPG